jgi:LruC domain-containing protein
MDFFETFSDDSKISSGRYYVTADNLPWALDISDNYDYPIEKTEITQGYLKFIPWVEASGQTYYDWFQSKAGYRDFQYIYAP